MWKLEGTVDQVLRGLGDDEKAKKEFLTACYMDPLRFFCPNGAQEMYIRQVTDTVQESRVPVIAATFANGVGKTFATLNILMNFILGPQNGWFDFPIFRHFPFPKLAWYCSTATALAEVVQPALMEIIPKGLRPECDYTTTKEGRQIISRMTFPNAGGWQVVFRTFNQDAATFESSNVGLMINDEPAPEAIWKAQKSRRRKGCITLLPMTPLYCPPYLLDEVKKAADEGRPGYSLLKASVYQACKVRGKRGHLDPDVIDAMVADYDPEEREARAYGEFMYFATRIVPNFIWDKHVVPADAFPIPPYSKWLHAVDPHDSRPAAAIYGAKTPFGRVIITAETPTEQDRPFWDMKTGMHPEDEVRMWAKIEDKGGYPKPVRILDRVFGWQNRGGKTIAEEYKKAGRKIGKDFTFLSSYRASGEEGEITFGHKIIRRALEPMSDGHPGLVIHDRCFHLPNGITHYIRKRLTGKGSEEKHQQDAPIVEKYKDFPDALRFLLCHDVKPKPPKQPKTYTEMLREKAAKHHLSDYGEFS